MQNIHPCDSAINGGDGVSAVEQAPAEGSSVDRLDRAAAERRLGLSHAHISTQATCTYAEGGRLVQLRYPTGEHEKRPVVWELDEGQPPIGERGQDYFVLWHRKRRQPIQFFSYDARRRMIKRVAEIPHRLLPELPVFVTLTYPEEWSVDGREWKMHLERLRKRFERKYGKLGVVWKLEFQKRGAPHFHLLIYFLDATGQSWTFKEWLSEAWYECVGSGDVKHLAAGTRVEPVRSLHGVTFYTSKYMAKVAEPSDGDDSGSALLNVGRYWGVWNEVSLKIKRVKVVLTEFEFYKLRRVLAKYLLRCGGRPKIDFRHNGIWVLLGDEVVTRLLDWVT